MAVANFAQSADYAAASKSANFFITQATPTVAVSDPSGAYTGTPYAATGSVTGVMSLNLGTPTFTYYLASDASFTSPLAGAPLDAGNYVVVAGFAQTTDYVGASKNVSFSITQATPTMSVSDAGGVYKGAPYAATGSVTGVSGVSLGTLTFKYYLASDTSFTSPLAGTPVNVGSYVVVGSFAQTTDYAAASKNLSFSITKATPIIIITGVSTFYNKNCASGDRRCEGGRIADPHDPDESTFPGVQEYRDVEHQFLGANPVRHLRCVGDLRRQRQLCEPGAIQHRQDCRYFQDGADVPTAHKPADPR